MKTLFVEARSKKKVVLPKQLISQLGTKVILASVVQHLDFINDVVVQLKKNNVKTFLSKGVHTIYKTQILGCDAKATSNLADKVNTILHIGSGLFHPKMILLEILDKFIDFKTNKLTIKQPKLFAFNPFENSFKEINKEEINQILKQRKAGLIKFLSSKNIAVLVSVKPGQSRIDDAIRFKKKYETIKNRKYRKNIYLFIGNTYNFDSLEDFPFVDCFVNSMCKRIAYDDSIRLPKPVVDIDYIEQFMKQIL